MENKVLSDNLEQVRRYDASLANSIEKSLIHKPLELINTQKGEYNLVFKGKPLHSQTGAQEEAETIAKNISNINEENSICIIFGLGLGYLFDETIARAKGKVLLYEPNIDILKTTFEIVELKELLSKPDVFLCGTRAKLQEHIQNLTDKDTKITISFLNSYRELFNEHLNELVQIVEYSHGEGQAYENTMNSLANLATLNTFENIKHIKETSSILSLRNKFQKKPALVVSAGPSLLKSIDTIKLNKDKMVIFCVGPALKVLLAHGITPDFLCIIEPHSTEGQLEGLVPSQISEVNLIIEPYTNTDIWNRTVKNKFIYPSHSDFVNNWLARTLKITNDNLFSQGTVSYCALSSAKLMGCDPIILVGQDLAYTDKRCYAKGSAYEELVCEINPDTNKFHIYPKDYEKYKKGLLGEKNSNDANTEVDEYLKFLNKNLYTVMGQNGEPLPTQSGYALFIKSFEAFAEKYPALKLINASVGGAQINGFTNLPLEKCEFKETIDKKLGEYEQGYDFSTLDDEIKKIKELITQSIALFGEMKVIALKIKKEFRPKNIEKLAEKFKSQQKFWHDNYFTKHDVLYFLLYRNFKVLSKESDKDNKELFEWHIQNCINDLKKLEGIITK